MSRVPSVRLLALAAVLVVSSLTLLAPSARADGGAIATRVYASTHNYLDDPSRVRVAATVTKTGSGNVYGVTGTFTFSEEGGDVIASGVPASADNGFAFADAPMPAGPTTYRVDFHGTGDYADSTTTVAYTPSTLRTVTVTPEPSLVKITAGSPKLTLTLAAYARFDDGSGAPGVTVSFHGPCLLRDPSRGMCMIPPVSWCTAVSDANGLASCQGAGTLGALVSILNGAVTFVSHSYNPAYHVVDAPVAIPLVVRS